MIVVRFREGKDDDLKKWYESLPEGERSRIVRKIMKKNIKSPKYISQNNNHLSNKNILSRKNADKKLKNLLELF